MASTATKTKPEFPLTIEWPDDDPETFSDPDELAFNLEWFDSDDPVAPVEVVDKVGRRVRLKIEGLQIVSCELANPVA